MTAPASPLLCVGQIMAAHGIRGEVRIAAHTADPLAIAAYGPLLLRDGRTVTLRKVRLASKGVVATLACITDRTAAEALCGQELLLPRDALPEPDDDESYYHVDLIGLAVIIADGTAFGTVCAVHDFGAGDVLEIQPVTGHSILIPFTREAVPDVRLAAGQITIDPAFLVKNV
jgi:16S rRNA processing protein RimM